MNKFKMSAITWHSFTSLKDCFGCASGEDFSTLCFARAFAYWCFNLIEVSFWTQTICCRTWAVIFLRALAVENCQHHRRSRLFVSYNFIGSDLSWFVKFRIVVGGLWLARFAGVICLEIVYDGIVLSPPILYRELTHSLMCLKINVQTQAFCNWLVWFVSKESYLTVINLF